MVGPSLARWPDSPIQMTPGGDTERQIEGREGGREKATRFIGQKIGAEKHGHYETEPAHLPLQRWPPNDELMIESACLSKSLTPALWGKD